MKLLLQSIKIIDQKSTFHLKKMDVLIVEGKIDQIAKNIAVKKDFKVFKQKGSSLSPAWIDLNMHIFEPGNEYREDLKSGLKAAGNGGFGAVCLMPNTNPPIDNNTQVAFIKNSSRNQLTKVFPLASISKRIEGKDLAEMYDMHESGAVGFTDGNRPVANAGLMERALLYAKRINGLILSQANDEDLSLGAQMNEGINSTRLGLKGAPKLAEELMLSRDITLLEHTGGKLHVSNVSTKKSVELIKKAKSKGLEITAGVSVFNLLLDDSVLLEYDTNFKVQPHLRGKTDIKALLKGLKDGTIDVISSGHTPLHIDEKKVEFENAEFGMSTIDCTFSLARQATKEILTEEELIAKFVLGYEIINEESPRIETGVKAHLTIFSSDKKYVLEASRVLSKGKNNPFIDKELIGDVFGIINGNKTNI